MNKDENPLDIFQKEAPEVAEAFAGVINSLINLKALDNKTKQLIYIAMKASTGEYLAVKAHVPMAKKLGATRDEIKETILLTLSVVGLKGVSSCLPCALETYDKS